jgi:DNA-directed RNA polymerase subunit RPC12/RpoP
MPVETVSCNNCGAPLDVGPGANYVTCGHCGSRLVVKRTGSSLYTELLEKIDQKADAMARQLAELRYHAELEKIDREWEQERQGFLSTDKHGKTHEPNAAAGMVGGAVAAVFGTFWTIMAFWITGVGRGMGVGPPAIFNCFPLFGLIFVGLGIWMFLKAPAVARKFEEAKRDYHHRRDGLTVDQFLDSPDDRPGR